MEEDNIPRARSELMRRVRAADTKPEMIVRRLAHSLGLRFRLHRRDLPGSPDLVFPKFRSVVFVHGCFWHRHPGCSRASTPKTRTEFWNAKFERNVARDARVVRQLRNAGWNVYTIWECETRNAAAVEMHLTQLRLGQTGERA